MRFQIADDPTAAVAILEKNSAKRPLTANFTVTGTAAPADAPTGAAKVTTSRNDALGKLSYPPNSDGGASGK